MWFRDRGILMKGPVYIWCLRLQYLPPIISLGRSPCKVWNTVKHCKVYLRLLIMFSYALVYNRMKAASLDSKSFCRGILLLASLRLLMDFRIIERNFINKIHKLGGDPNYLWRDSLCRVIVSRFWKEEIGTVNQWRVGVKNSRRRFSYAQCSRCDYPVLLPTTILKNKICVGHS